MVGCLSGDNTMPMACLLDVHVSLMQQVHDLPKAASVLHSTFHQRDHPILLVQPKQSYRDLSSALYTLQVLLAQEDPVPRPELLLSQQPDREQQA